MYLLHNGNHLFQLWFPQGLCLHLFFDASKHSLSSLIFYQSILACELSGVYQGLLNSMCVAESLVFGLLCVCLSVKPSVMQKQKQAER